jgi:hypothetical protein
VRSVTVKSSNKIMPNEYCSRRWADHGLDPTSRLSLLVSGDASAVIDRLTAELAERFSTSHHHERVMDMFMATSTDIDDYRDRYATVRIMEKLSGIQTDPRPRVGRPDTVEPQRRRPFTDTETVLVRLCSLKSAAKAGIIGIAEAGAGSGELHHIVSDDVERDSIGTALAVRVRGTERAVKSGYPVACARELVVPGWCRQRFSDLVRASPASQTLLYAGHATDPSNRQSTVDMAIGSVLKDAGLHDDPTVKPSSVRNTAARARYHRDGIEAAAGQLGHDDLNFVMQEIGIRPHKPTRQR